MPKGCVLFKFASHEDMLSILIRAPWMFGRRALSLEKWHKDFDPSVPKIRQAPIWIQLPGLPLHCWNPEVFKGIAKVMGPLLVVDSATKNRSRLINARICALVRLDKPLLDDIWMDLPNKSWVQPLFYELDHFRCSTCRNLGHFP